MHLRSLTMDADIQHCYASLKTYNKYYCIMPSAFSTVCIWGVMCHVSSTFSNSLSNKAKHIYNCNK